MAASDSTSAVLTPTHHFEPCKKTLSFQDSASHHFAASQRHERTLQALSSSRHCHRRSSYTLGFTIPGASYWSQPTSVSQADLKDENTKITEQHLRYPIYAKPSAPTAHPRRANDQQMSHMMTIQHSVLKRSYTPLPTPKHEQNARAPPKHEIPSPASMINSRDDAYTSLFTKLRTEKTRHKKSPHILSRSLGAALYFNAQ